MSCESLRGWVASGAFECSPMNALTLLFFIFGFLTIIVGAELLVRGASRLSRLAGISPLVVGLTVVAFGTSSPELAVSLQSVFAGSADLALGNVVGSNIFNILGILGPAALLAPRGIDVPAPALSLDLPLALAAAVACLPIFFTGGRIARWEGCFFLACYAAYVWLLVRLATAPPPGSLVIGYLALVVLIPAAALAAGLIRTRR